jgi:hypothetical protein
MGFTYVLTEAVGQVRLLVPDKNADAYELEDDEIDFFLGQQGQNVTAAAVMACRWLARKFAQEPTFKADGLSISNGERARIFAERAEELAAQLQGGYSSVPLSREGTDSFSEAAQYGDYGTAKVIYVRI